MKTTSHMNSVKQTHCQYNHEWVVMETKHKHWYKNLRELDKKWVREQKSAKTL